MCTGGSTTVPSCAPPMDISTNSMQGPSCYWNHFFDDENIPLPLICKCWVRFLQNERNAKLYLSYSKLLYKQLQKDLIHFLTVGAFQILTIVLLVAPPPPPPPFPPYQCWTKFAMTFNQASLNIERGRRGGGGGLKVYSIVQCPFRVRYLQKIGKCWEKCFLQLLVAVGRRSTLIPGTL